MKYESATTWERKQNVKRRKQRMLIAKSHRIVSEARTICHLNEGGKVRSANGNVWEYDRKRDSDEYLAAVVRNAVSIIPL